MRGRELHIYWIHTLVCLGGGIWEGFGGLGLYFNIYLRFWKFERMHDIRSYNNEDANSYETITNESEESLQTVNKGTAKR